MARVSYSVSLVVFPLVQFNKRHMVQNRLQGRPSETTVGHSIYEPRWYLYTCGETLRKSGLVTQNTGRSCDTRMWRTGEISLSRYCVFLNGHDEIQTMND